MTGSIVILTSRFKVNITLFQNACTGILPSYCDLLDDSYQQRIQAPHSSATRKSEGKLDSLANPKNFFCFIKHYQKIGCAFDSQGSWLCADIKFLKQLEGGAGVGRKKNLHLARIPLCIKFFSVKIIPLANTEQQWKEQNFGKTAAAITTSIEQQQQPTTTTTT